MKLNTRWSIVLAILQAQATNAKFIARSRLELYDDSTHCTHLTNSKGLFYRKGVSVDTVCAHLQYRKVVV